MAIHLAEANRAIEAALAKSTELGVKISVTVCDSFGRLVAHQRMDGVFPEAPHSSIGKAIAATDWGRPSGEFSTQRRIESETGVVIGEGAPELRRRGGLPISRNGEIVGAVGVSGAKTDEEDEECARAAINALGLKN